MPGVDNRVADALFSFQLEGNQAPSPRGTYLADSASLQNKGVSDGLLNSTGIKFFLGNMHCHSSDSLQSVNEKCVQISYVGGQFPIVLSLDQVSLLLPMLQHLARKSGLSTSVVSSKARTC